MQRFIFKAKQISTGKQEILQKSFRYILNPAAVDTAFPAVGTASP